MTSGFCCCSFFSPLFRNDRGRKKNKGKTCEVSAGQGLKWLRKEAKQIWSSPKLVSNAPNKTGMLSARLLRYFSLCTISIYIYIYKLNTKSYLGIMLRAWRGQAGGQWQKAGKSKLSLDGADGFQGCSRRPWPSILILSRRLKPEWDLGWCLRAALRVQLSRAPRPGAKQGETEKGKLDQSAN